MKKAAAEKKLVVVMFVLVLVVFSLAQRDTQRITHLYSAVIKKAESLLASASDNQ